MEPYPALPADERTDKARALRLPLRYRAGRWMVLRPESPLGVVRIVGYEMDGGHATYRAQSLSGARSVIGEHLIVPPEPALLEAELREGVPGPGDMLTPADLARLRETYVWVSMNGSAGGDPDGLLTEILRDPRQMWGGPPEDGDALPVWSSQKRVRGAHGDRPGWMARLPLALCCLLADERAVVINHGEPRFMSLDPSVLPGMIAFARGTA